MRLKATVCTGAAAASDITCTDIESEDEVIAVIQTLNYGTASAGAVFTGAVALSEVSITADDTIQCATTNTSNCQLLVLWQDMNDG